MSLTNPTIEQIGLENLPNIYVNKIIIDVPAGYGSFGIGFNYIFFDDEENPKWSNSELLTKYLLIKIIIRDGEGKPLDFGATSVSSPFGGIPSAFKTEFNITPDQWSDKINSYHTFYRDNITYREEEHEVFLEVRMELDMQKLRSDYNYLLDFPNNVSNTYKGPSFIDKIFTVNMNIVGRGDIIIPDKSFVYKVSGIEIPPFVHSHEGRFMQGSRHRETAHENATLETSDIEKVYQVGREVYSND